MAGLAGAFAADTSGAGGFFAAIGVGAVVVFPLLYGIMGFIGVELEVK